MKVHEQSTSNEQPYMFQLKNKYSRTSIARTLMAHSPDLARTISMVPTGHFRHNPPWICGTTLGKN